MLEVSKRGPVLKDRLVGVAEKYKGLFNREPLRADDGVKNFRDTLRPQFVKGGQSVFLFRFYLFIRTKRGNTEMADWVGKFSSLLKRLKDSWMDLLPLSAMTQETTRESVPG